jgi:hypothetical protein
MAKRKKAERLPGRPPKSKRVIDAAEAKRYPYSIRATIRSIREFGLEPPTLEARTKVQFVAETADILHNLQAKYPAHAGGNADELLERIEGGHQDLRYFDLRYIAECAGVPTSVLYAFTHLLGDVARDGDRENALELLDSMIEGIQAARTYVASATQDDLREAFQIVYRPGVPDAEYHAKLDCLKLMSVAYNARRVSRLGGDGLTG